MAQSTETALTSTWVEIVPDGESYVAQNNGNQDLRLWWGTTAPSADKIGFIFKPVGGADAATFLTGPIWARAAADVGSIIVNQ